ncbi:hypothetical protein BS47DRAFT_888679 [Hydnum rufescens UP504]|uniref:DUF6534 domain-containing protein n=1 Tax=Hydnum rufescens UP504 TaxID=1448309 RepID=A0A9P6DUE9_9AGAM|nr:hypothetical protein BS47DRAFT_888679 [Hydnum rufescens UP504]
MSRTSFPSRSSPSLPFIMEVLNATPVNILGGSFFGNLLTALCFGVLTIQISSYYHSFPNDGRLVKLAVCFLGTCGAFQLACITQSLYSWFVANHNHHFTLRRATWEFLTYQTSTACASVTVQTFFAHRVYSLSGNLYLGALVQVLVLLQFGFAAATGIRATMILEFRVIVKECTWLTEAWLITQAIADVVIATYMCILLRRRRTGFPKTDSVINRMVLYTVSTGLITSILSCFLLGMVAKYGYHFSVVVISMSLGVFYSITMLTNLHMRTRLRVRLDTPTPLELIGHSIKKRIRRDAGDHQSGECSHAAGVNITTEAVSGDVDINPMRDSPSFNHRAPWRRILNATILYM